MRIYTKVKIGDKSHFGLNLALLACVLFLFFAGSAMLYGYSKVDAPLTSYSKEIGFEVKAGESVGRISQNLQSSGLISSAWVFRLFTSFSGLEGKIQAGSYRLNSNLSIRQVLERLVEGKAVSDEVKITFKEGDTLAEYADTIKKAGLADAAKEFLELGKSAKPAASYDFAKDKPVNVGLEGYLFPDTYIFSKIADAQTIIAKMLENFDHKLTPQMRVDIRKQGRTIFEVLTLASIVEGEVGRNFKPGTVLSEEDLEKLSEERRLVAGVFYNRLNTKHALESDATVNYITGKGRASVTLDDTKIDSPFNTYRYRGLPPHPINNPSLDSIIATIYPADTDYFYFLSKPSGEAVFAKTLEEHNRNKQLYLK